MKLLLSRSSRVSQRPLTHSALVSYQTIHKEPRYQMSYQVVRTEDIIYDFKAQVSDGGDYLLSFNGIPYRVNKRFTLGEVITAILMRDIIQISNGFINNEKYSIKKWNIPKLVSFANVSDEDWPELNLRLRVTLYFDAEKGYKWRIRLRSKFFNKPYDMYGVIAASYLEVDIYNLLLRDVFYLLSILNIRQ